MYRNRGLTVTDWRRDRQPAVRPLSVRRRPCAARETGWPENPQPGAFRAAGVAGSRADWDPARSPCGRDARSRGQAAGSRSASPRKNGIDPATSSAATINPQAAIVTGFGRNDAKRGHHGLAGAGMAIEHHRERDHADAQRDEREQETDAASHDDQPPSLRGGQHAPCEIGNFGCRLVAERRRRRSPVRWRSRSRKAPVTAYRARAWRRMTAKRTRPGHPRRKVLRRVRDGG